MNTLLTRYTNICGGISKQTHHEWWATRVRTPVSLAIAIVLLTSCSVLAQGSIYGTVTNADATVPANGDISFYGYLDNTDEEIRIETSVGAGYDSGFWFDDFQNYLTESPGNPYDFHFQNTSNGEGCVLSGLIPDNSFQPEDITLTSVSWPASPTGLVGQVASGSSVLIGWDKVSGLSYHVYRRVAPSSGSFFRIDAPDGSLANPGIIDGSFVDTTVDGAGNYQYLVIAEDATERLGAHSTVLTVNVPSGCCVIRGDIDHSGSLPIDIEDLSVLISYMFADGPPPPCLEEADVNGDGADVIDIADLSHLVNYMFTGGPPPPGC